MSAGQYLWTKITFSDGKVAYSVARQGINGSKGDKGDTGSVASCTGAGTGNAVTSIDINGSKVLTYHKDASFVKTAGLKYDSNNHSISLEIGR